MKPEDTDQFKTFEQLVERLAQGPKKESDDLEEAEASKTDPSDKPPDDASEDSET